MQFHINLMWILIYDLLYRPVPPGNIKRRKYYKSTAKPIILRSVQAPDFWNPFTAPSLRHSLIISRCPSKSFLRTLKNKIKKFGAGTRSWLGQGRIRLRNINKPVKPPTCGDHDLDAQVLGELYCNLWGLEGQLSGRYDDHALHNKIGLIKYK